MDPTLIAALPTLMWTIFAGAALLSIALGTLLAYHWYRYAMNPQVASTALMVYGGIAFLLLSALFGATISVIAIV